MAIRFRSLSVVLLISAGMNIRPAQAQFPVFGHPSTKKSTGNAFVDAALETADDQMGFASPLLLDQSTAFKPIKHQEEFENFQPTLLKPATVEDLIKPLPPGDYAINVTAYCAQWSIHQPGQGLPYKLARAQGRQAKAITALLMRGTLEGVSPNDLQAASWRIQGGVPLEKWSDDDRALIHQLVPDYEEGLKQDGLDKFIDTYNKYAGHFGVPPFEQGLSYLGKSGQAFVQMQEVRSKLIDRTTKNERLPEMLYEPQPDGLPLKLSGATHPKASEWAEVKDQKGVFARFTVIDGNLGSNLLEFRITSDAVLARQKKIEEYKKKHPEIGARMGKVATLSLVSYEPTAAVSDMSGGPSVADFTGTYSAIVTDVKNAIRGASPATVEAINDLLLDQAIIDAANQVIGDVPLLALLSLSGDTPTLEAYPEGKGAQILPVVPMMTEGKGSDDGYGDRPRKTPAGDSLKAPGMPGKADGYDQPNNWGGRRVHNPKGPGYGVPSDTGKTWVPVGNRPPNQSGGAHGGPHWDVVDDKGNHENVYPGGKSR